MMRIRDEALLTRRATGYVTDGLVCWLDGINNTRAGHNASSRKWEDLSGNENDFSKTAQTTGDIIILDNAYRFCGTESQGNAVVSTAFQAMLGTYEIVFSADTDARQQAIFVHQLATGVEMHQYASGTINLATNNNQPRYAGSVSEFKNTPTTFSLIPWTAAYKNGSPVSISGSSSTGSAKTTNQFVLGAILLTTIGNPTRLFNGNIYSLRLYDRILTAAEIAQNAAVDKKRFGTGGTV